MKVAIKRKEKSIAARAAARTWSDQSLHSGVGTSAASVFFFLEKLKHIDSILVKLC
jgi:hypothetical protein